MKLKKALSLALALVMSLAMAVPAFAAPVNFNTRYNDFDVTLSDVTAEGTATAHGSWGGDVTLSLYTVPVGSSMKIMDYCDMSISKCEQGADGAYTGGDSKHTGFADTIVWDESYAGAVWWVSLWMIDSDGFLVKVEGASTPTQPEQPTTPTEPQPEVKTANPSNDKLTVNGVEGTPTVYNIDNNNYFKIRDVAALLNGTEKQFSVGYDAEKQSVTATTGQGYEKLPTDLAGAPAGAGEAKASGDAIYVDGAKITPTVYNINGNNYFKLRDLGEALGFKVDWSAEQGVFIETK